MDTQLFYFVNQFASRWQLLDMVAIFFARYSAYVFIGVLAVMAFANWRNLRRAIIGAFAAGIISRYFVTEIIRFFYHRPRPFEVLNGVVQLVPHDGGGSFPSGHAAFYFALSWSLFFWNRRLGLAFLAGTILMTIARVFAGVHYPSDILAGFFVGFASASFMWLFQRIISKNRIS